PAVKTREHVRPPEIALGDGQSATALSETARAPAEDGQHLAVDVERDHLAIGESLEKPERDDARPGARVQHARAGGQAPVHAPEELLDAPLEPEEPEPGVVEVGDAPVLE